MQLFVHCLHEILPSEATDCYHRLRGAVAQHCYNGDVSFIWEKWKL